MAKMRTPPQAKPKPLDECGKCGVRGPKDGVVFTENSKGTCIGCLMEAVNAEDSPLPMAIMGAETQKQALHKLVNAEARDRGKASERAAVAARELAARELARRRLLPYVLRMSPNYLPGWVHKDICARLERFLDDVVAKKSPRLILMLPPRSGKLVADSTPVLTPGGWTTHGALRPGDKVFGVDGSPVNVRAVSPADLATLAVETTDGETIRVHPNHEWTVYNRPRKRWETVETRYLATRKLWSGGRAVFQLPPRPVLEFPPQNLMIPPYVLGLWLGDGTASKACITHDARDQTMVDGVTACGYTPTSVCIHNTAGVVTTYFSGRLLQELTALGVRNNKHIPAVYLRSSVAQRLSLLAGLVDSDGTVTQQDRRVAIATTNEALRDNVVELVRSFGWRASVARAEPTLSSSGVQGRKPVFTIGFSPTLDIPTRLPRKRVEGFTPVARRIGIRSVTPTTPEAGRCIQVDAGDGLYLVGRQLIPTHNSELASVRFPEWALGKHPWLEFISTSHTASLANSFSRRVRDDLKSAEFNKLFPASMVSPDAQGVEGWLTTEGGGLLPAGVGGPIVGRGAHILLIDDPTKNAEEAYSETTRESIWEWFTGAAYTRLHPGGGVIVIMQRWHDDDLSGRLEAKMREGEGDEYEIVRYPAIAEDDEPHRKKGEALHPERYSLEQLHNIRRTVGPRVWSALYQQNPVADDGEFFKATMFGKFTGAAPPGLTYYAAWDLAIGQKTHNDWTVGVVVGVDQNDMLYVVDVRRGRWSSDEIVQQVFEVQRKWGPTAQAIEKGHIAMAIGPYLRKRIREERLYELHVKEVTARADKVARARSIQGRMEQGMVLFPHHAPWFPELQREMLRFPSGTHDDQVDAIAWVGVILGDLIGPRAAAAPDYRKQGWRKRLDELLRGQRGNKSWMGA